MSRVLISSRKGTPPPTVTVAAAATTALSSNYYSEDGSSDEETNCPLCIQSMDSSDCRFKPCPCGYQICRFCWHRIREEGNERCPACRRIYTDEDVEFLPAEEEKPKKKRQSGKNMLFSGSSTTVTTASASSSGAAPNILVPTGILPSRRHLVDIRVIQKNLVYVIGISARIAHENILSETQYFGQFGKVLKIVVNRKNTGAPLPAEKVTAGSGVTTTSGSAYVTYAKVDEAGRAIAFIDGSVFDGRVLRATYGTTKYCSYFLRGINCPNSGCMYLHEEGDTSDSYTKEELSSGKMHLHSSLVDRSEGAALRQFGTLMYRPAPPPTRVVSPPSTNVSTVIINHEHTGQDLVRPASAPALNALRQDLAGMAEAATQEPRSPPINLAQCEDDAMTFLNRLSRWNNSSDILDQGSPRSHSVSHDHALFPDGAGSCFDPFSEAKPASPKISSAWLANLAQRSQNHPNHGAPMAARALPTISKGPLLGFDWSPVLQNKGLPKCNSLEQPALGIPLPFAALPVVSFKNHGANFLGTPPLPPPPPPPASTRPAPVGSPVGFASNAASTLRASAQPPQIFASPAPVAPRSNNLEQLFAGSLLNQQSRQPSSNPLDSRRVLDASQLEQQFFRQTQPPLNVSLAANEILSASSINFEISSRPTDQVKGEESSLASRSKTKPTVTKPTTVELEFKESDAPSATMEKGKRKVAPPPPVALARIKELTVAREALMDSPTPTKSTLAQSKGKSATLSKSSPGTPSSKGVGSVAQPSNPSKSNHFASLNDIGCSNELKSVSTETDTDVSSQFEEEASLIEVRASTGEIQSQTAASKKKNKGKKETFTTPIVAALPARRPAPVLPSQPNYLPVWPTAENHYEPTSTPNYTLMTEPERNIWRKWLEEECKANKAEEALLRSKVNKIHSEICNWLTTYTHSI